MKSLTTKQLNLIQQLIAAEINLIQDCINDGTYDDHPEAKKDMKAKVEELDKILVITLEL